MTGQNNAALGNGNHGKSVSSLFNWLVFNNCNPER